MFRFLNPQFPVPGDKKVSLPPGTGRAPLTWEFYSPVSGKKHKVRVIFLLLLKVFSMPRCNILGYDVLNFISRKPQKPGEEQGTDSPSEPPEGTNPADTLILDFWSPGL